jgi:hypothetical protein
LVHVFWIVVAISLAAALYIAYLESPASVNQTNTIIPKQNLTITSNATTITQTVESTKPPTFPNYVILWGYIGASVYVLKTATTRLYKKTFKEEYTPHLIIRLFIGPALAIVIYFILVTGGFFGLTIDWSKVPQQSIQYVYAAVAFITGYFVNDIIEVLSTIVTSLFRFKPTEN